MSAINIAFIRHGDYLQRKDTPSAMQPFALSREGVQQARTCATEIVKFAEENALDLHSVFHCSTLLRAWQTADIIRNQLKARDSIEISQSPALVERSVGAVANLTITEIEHILEQDPRFKSPPKGWKSDSAYCLPFDGAESLMDSGARVKNYVIEVVKQLESYTKTSQLVLFIGHGASIRHAAYLLGMITYDQIKQYSMYHASPVIYRLGEDGWLHVGGQWKIRQQNAFTD